MRLSAQALLQQRVSVGQVLSSFPTFLDLADRSVSNIQANWSSIASYYPGYETRLKGFGGINTDAGLGSSYSDVWVINTNDSGSGSFRQALLTTGKTRVKFAVIGDIVDVNRTGFDCTDNTLIDGRGYPGTIYGSIISQNISNVAGQYFTVTQPFKYGNNPSGGCIGNSNVATSYWYKINMWDTGDIVFTNGCYYFGPGGPNGGGIAPGPYYYTVDSCRIGPNPGEYAIMSPILGNNPGVVPGYLNNINNDARNGKAAESALDHNAVESGDATHAQMAQTVHGTFVDTICQGCCARNFKSRSQYVDTANCLVTKYGEDYNRGGSVGAGQGSVVENDGLINLRGCVYIPYVANEAFVGFQPAVASRNSITPWYVTNPTADYFATNFSTEGGTNYHGSDNAHIYSSWTSGQTLEAPSQTTGFDWTSYYTLTHTDCSNYTNAQSLVHRLEDVAATRSGNPCSTLQPPNWRDVHTGSTFPVTA